MRMTAAAIILRLGRSQDARAVAIMSRDQIEFGLGWKYHPEHVCRLIRAPDTVTLVASDRGRVAGFAIMEFGDEHGHLVLLAVRPEYQRQGIGRRMIDWLLESCATAGIALVHLELRASNEAARTFYRAVGFRETRLVPRYYCSRESAICMVRTLRSTGFLRVNWQPPAVRA